MTSDQYAAHSKFLLCRIDRKCHSSRLSNRFHLVETHEFCENEMFPLHQKTLRPMHNFKPDLRIKRGVYGHS